MARNIMVLFFLAVFAGLQAQECPLINYPAPGSTNIPVDATITWPAVDGVEGYSLTLGTFPGGEDILSRRSAGLTNSFTPPTGLPENTRVYVTISMYLTDNEFIFCSEEMYFETENVTTPPPCTQLSVPLANATNVDNEAVIEWQYAPSATGYVLTIRNAAGEILVEDDVGNRLTYNARPNLPPESEIFVYITPYNENGPAEGCVEERFTTGSGMIDCGPFRDPQTGDFVRLGPEIEFPSAISVCLDNLPTPINATTEADGFRWYQINSDNTETLVSATGQVMLSDLGLYRYEAYNFIEQHGITYECAESRIFRVISSELPTIINIEREDFQGGANLTVEASGAGVYEYALDSPQGPFQDSPFFEGVPRGVHTVFVRDKNGCGTREQLISLGLPRDAFPKFFTPNGDGINDYWQFSPLPEHAQIELQSLFIFDRYGLLLAQVLPGSKGWDGRSNGKPLPATNYWFRATDSFNNELTGYFVLKR